MDIFGLQVRHSPWGVALIAFAAATNGAVSFLLHGQDHFRGLMADPDTTSDGQSQRCLRHLLRAPRSTTECSAVLAVALVLYVCVCVSYVGLYVNIFYLLLLIYLNTYPKHICSMSGTCPKKLRICCDFSFRLT